MTTFSPEVNAPDGRDDRALFMHLDPVVRLNDDQFYELCRLNRNLRIERAAGGGMSIMPPAGGETSRRNAEIARQLGNWARRTRTGSSFDSSCGFVLPNGAVRSPDASWVLRERLDALTDEQRSRFLPLCPDFVVELRSPTDDLAALHDKMREYVDNWGEARLADRSSRPGSPSSTVPVSRSSVCTSPRASQPNRCWRASA